MIRLYANCCFFARATKDTGVQKTLILVKSFTFFLQCARIVKRIASKKTRYQL